MKKEGDVSIIPCKVNGLPLSFIFDTGASDVTISLTEATFMLKNDYLTKDDIIGSENYLDASGNISEGIVINLREIEIEGLKLTNVKASIVKNLDAPLLLGQSALSKLGIIKIDLDKNQLTILNSSKLSIIEPNKNKSLILNSNTYKKAFILLAKCLTTSNDNLNEISQYFSLNTTNDLEEELLHLHTAAEAAGDSSKYNTLWAFPFDAYKTLNASSYYYTFIDPKTYNLPNRSLNIDDSSYNNSLYLEVVKHLKLFSNEKNINWNLLDTSSITVINLDDNVIKYSFKCDTSEYVFLTTVSEESTNDGDSLKLYLPCKFDTQSFFHFRRSIYTYLTGKIDDIKNAKDQNTELSFFYGDLLNRFEDDYNNLSIRDKENFSELEFEPAFWCYGAANLYELGVLDPENDPDLLVYRIRYLTQGIKLYEKFLYPFVGKNYYWTHLYATRGEYRYKLEDYAGAYEDYKKAINVYEKNLNAKEAMKYSIAEYYYDFSKICFDSKKYEECKSSIEKGINTYFDGIEQYEPSWILLHTLKGNLDYFIYKNKQQACEEWSKAGELGDNNAFDYIKKYCNK